MRTYTTKTETKDIFHRAQKFFEKRGFAFGFGGRGKYRGKYHLSTMRGGFWRSKRSMDMYAITDAPHESMKELLSL